MKLINLRELKRMYAADPGKCVAQLSEAIEEGHIKASNLSLRDLFEGLHEDGSELLRMIDTRKSGRVSLMEAASAVDSSAFTSISGQMIFNATKEAFQMDQFLWPELVTTVQTNFIHGEIIPGIGGLGDVAEPVQEGEDYPTVGVNEEYTKTAPTEKRGFIVPITREAIIQDRTGLLLDRCGQGGFFLGLNKEKRVLSVATGSTVAGLPAPNNYNRNGTSYNTYLTSGAYINSTANNALSGAGNEWTALQTLEILASAVLDPNTNEPIAVQFSQLLVPVALRRTAGRIVHATSIEHVDLTTNSASTIRTTSENPYKGSGIQILSNNWVKTITNSATAWFAGDFKRAIRYMECWGIETAQAAANNPKEFHADIWVQHKVSERGVCQMIEPRYVYKSTP